MRSGRGHGLPQMPTLVASTGQMAQKEKGARLARLHDDDAMSFKSEEFETSSRIGGARPPMTKAPIDAKELAQKLKVNF